ncbi:TonB-dependent receptor [Blastochloris viridis]|uniref:Hemophore HasA outer membrane receptor HasR n=1 Tax=Blastochloris viridis TaxID=1079 RepID=A0A182CXV5_BLAVI|nr:TonB-dependent receptor [Blastochloris viridis]BAR98030.1 hemophore HasA outer membrane receptor HasR [Blastochloris viridis]
MTAALAAGLALHTPAFAQSQPGAPGAATATFRIAPQPLSQALVEFSRTTGIQLFVTADVVRGVNSPGVQGTLNPTAALSRLLAGSGLSYRFTNGSTVTITRPGTAAIPTAGDADGAIALDVIDVTGGWNAASGSGFQGTPDWVYDTPASVSVISREAIQTNPNRTARDLFASVPGVLASSDNAQNPGVNVNIRGLQDQNRIAMMIDGARQNFQRAGHGSTGYSYVDTALIREVDIEKTTTSGVGSAGSLGGSVNFRTIEAGDIIAPGRLFGTELDLTKGDNEYQLAGSASAAARISDSFSLLAAYSHKKLGEYAIGKNGAVDYIGWPLEAPVFTGSETSSYLFKAEAKPTDASSLTVSWLRYDAAFSQGQSAYEDEQAILNDTLSAAYHWKPDGSLIDLKARLWYNNVKDDEYRPKRSSDQPETWVNYSLATIGGSADNTSRVQLPFGDLSFNYGFEGFHDDGNTEATGSGIDANALQAFWYQGANPTGTRDIYSGFGKATFERDWLSLSGGIRYDYYDLAAQTTIGGKPVTTSERYCQIYRANGTCRLYRTIYTTTHPSYGVDVDRSGGAFSPTANLTLKPLDGLQLFGTYSQGYRPPTLMEAAFGGAHVGGYAGQYAPNPAIEPEEAETWEIGANLSSDNVLVPGDKVRMKVVDFYRRVQNYIAVGKISLVPAVGVAPYEYDAYVNLDGLTLMRGVEVEANYDAGPFYIGGSFSYLKADYADTYLYNGASYDAASGVLFVPPKMKYTVDGGVRLFDKALTLGGRLTHVGAADQHFGLIYGSYLTDAYTIYDLYGSYAVTEAVKLRFAVNNVTDVAYVPALGQVSLPAPGRTTTVSVNFKF